MDWKLYYVDRTTFSSDDGEWADAPAWGVVAVVVPDKYVKRSIDVGRGIGCGDYYLFDGPEPWWVDCGGLLDSLIHKGVMSADQSLSDLSADTLTGAGVKFGRSVNNETWRSLSSWIVQDADALFGVDGDRPEPPDLSG